MSRSFLDPRCERCDHPERVGKQASLFSLRVDLCNECYLAWYEFIITTEQHSDLCGCKAAISCDELHGEQLSLAHELRTEAALYVACLRRSLEWLKEGKSNDA